MCGFLGKVSFEKIDHGKVDEFNNFIVCRGPDETKYLTNKNFSGNSNYSFSLIFNRLKILDLSNLASQPMVSKDFKNIAKRKKTPYGKKGASKKIHKIITNINLQNILKKEFHDL